MAKKELKIHIKETRGLYQGRRLEGKVENTWIKTVKKPKKEGNKK
jgi:hypothetical protein